MNTFCDNGYPYILDLYEKYINDNKNLNILK